MGRKIEILTGSNQLERGQQCPFCVRINVDRDTKVRGIHARFLGAERTKATYTESYTDSKGKRKTRTRTAVQDVPVVDEYFHLFGDPKPGFFEVIGDALSSIVGGGNHATIPAGQHDFQLEVPIPNDAPPSFEGDRCSVFYKIEVRIDIPVWPDPTQDHHFELISVPGHSKSKPVLVRHPDPLKGRGFWDKAFGKDLKLDVALDRDVIVPGETFSGMFHLVPSETLRLDAVRVSLVATEKVVADGHSDSYVHSHEFSPIQTPNQVSKPLNHEFELVAPQLELFTAKGKNFEVQWHVALRLDVPWSVDPVVEIPVEYYGQHGATKAGKPQK